MTFTSSAKAVLVLGSTGRTGLECIRALSNHPVKTEIHAFCRDPTKFSEEDKSLCASIVKGNAKDSADVEKALRETNAEIVIVSVGNGDSVEKSDTRTASAQALARAMNKPEFKRVKALIVSSLGTADSKIIVGMGIGMLISYHLRHVLDDHEGQEAAFASPDLNQRTIVVRATNLTDNKPKGKVLSFDGTKKAPTMETDRADLASWVADEICRSKWDGGRRVNITGAK